MNGSRRAQRTELIGRNDHCGPSFSGSVRTRGFRIRHRDASPEIRSLQHGRVRLGSVAPLLSRRAKALAMETFCDNSSDDEYYDTSDKTEDDGYSDDEYSDEVYDYYYRPYPRYRQNPSRMNLTYEEEYDRDDDEYEDEPGPSSYPIQTVQKIFRSRPLPKAPVTSVRRPAATNKTAVKLTASKKTAAARTAKAKSKNNPSKSTASARRTGPVTRSRGAATETTEE